MCSQEIVWTVLPYGRVEQGAFAGHLRVSLVVSPRLISPTSRTLADYDGWMNWPETLNAATFSVRWEDRSIPLERIAPSIVNAARWRKLFHADKSVASFEFRNMGEVNLHSYPVRTILETLREHYGKLAVESTESHPRLLPWHDAHPALKAMLEDFGARTERRKFRGRVVEFPEPGFERFFDDSSSGLGTELRNLAAEDHNSAPGVDVAGRPQGDFPVRVLPQWRDAVPGEPPDALFQKWRSEAEYAFWQADRFYRRTLPTDQQKRMARPSREDIPPSPEAPDFEFHRIISAHADHPQLLRELGLVIDCALPADSPLDETFRSAGPVEGDFGLEIEWDDDHEHRAEWDRCPRTAFRLDATRFVTRSRTDEHDRGMLRLQYADDQVRSRKHTFHLYQVDPDGSALKTVNFLLTAQRLIQKSLDPRISAHGEVTYTTGDEQPVAALRSGGLGVIQHGRAEAIARRALDAARKDEVIRKGLKESQQIVLFSEDTLRGYRVDVQARAPGEPEQPWQTLCGREGRYVYYFGDVDGIADVEKQEAIEIRDDEGFVTAASTTSQSDAPDDHYLHESLFRWAGRSLVTQPTERTIRARDDGAGVQRESPETVESELPVDRYRLETVFRVPRGSLPKQRLGHECRFRVRLVNLAGNSLDRRDPSLHADVQMSEWVTLRRFEKVDPPALVHRTKVSEGESLQRMVIRSNWDENSAAFVSRLSQPADGDFAYEAANERHLVPPKAAQLLCEQHGMFDEFFTDPRAIKRGYEIAVRESRSIYDAPGVELVTPTSLQRIATTQDGTPQPPSKGNPTGDRVAGGQYVVYRRSGWSDRHVGPELQTPYLPDPAAAGVAIRAMPGHALPGVTRPMRLGEGAEVVRMPSKTGSGDELMIKIAYRGRWPDLEGFKIRLKEREQGVDSLPCKERFLDDGLPKWNAVNRTLTFFVAKGRIVRLRYASFIPPDLSDCFGIRDWVPKKWMPYLKSMGEAGAAWLLTPDRELTLVHASAQPVCLPKFESLRLTRELGDTCVHLKGTVLLHKPSTGKLEIQAAWTDHVDDPQRGAPQAVRTRGQLGEIRLEDDGHNRFDLNDAVESQQIDSAPDESDSGDGYKVNRQRGDRHELGDTKCRLVKYTMQATSRFREYLPLSEGAPADALSRVGPPAAGQGEMPPEDDWGAPVLVSRSANLMIVPASSPPAAPRVAYTVPTVRWSETAGPGRLQSERRGNGLRVWLERPWFTSGIGELLGVVVPAKGEEIPNKLIPLVTQWGLDPVWFAKPPTPTPRPVDFLQSVTDEVLLLPEVAEKVHVVGHRVYWDADRGLWRCDIEIDSGAGYMPFVRLALVRYQPNAISGAKMSPVTLADFAQLLPSRHAEFQYSDKELHLRLSGRVPQNGPTSTLSPHLESRYLGPAPPPSGVPLFDVGGNRLELVVQTRDPDIDSDLAWSDFAQLGSALVTEESDAPGDQLMWDITADLPDTAGRPARAVIRECERYYTDRTVGERIRGEDFQRRVLEERLVYTAHCNLT